MSTEDLELAAPPTKPRHRELWLQHAAGLILFEDARRYALEKLDPKLEPAARKAAEKAVDDTLYGLMMIVDGVTGALTKDDLSVDLRMVVRLLRGDEVVEQLDLGDGDGMCMGIHGWREGNFGEDPVTAPPKPKAPTKRSAPASKAKKSSKAKKGRRP